MGVTSLLLLSCLGLAVTSQAQDCTRPVGGPNMSLKDTDILLQQFPVGSQVSFVCDVGYMSAGGSRTITCTADGWTRLAMRCERKNCGSFEEVEHGTIDYSEGTEFGDKIVISCEPGYRLVGRGEIFCEDGGWNGRKPTCEAVTCEPPAQVQHGSFSPVEESYSFRAVVQYSCQRDFTLNGSNSISCSGDGTFKPAPPTCIRVQCEEPMIKNAVWVSGSRPPYGYKATVTHKCDPGFKMIGQQTIVCELDSQWSPKPPTCERIPTTPKATTTTTTTIPPRTTPKGGSDGDDKSDGNKNLALGLGIFAGIVVLGLCIVCYFIGIPAFKKKKGTDRTHPDNDAPKVEENLPLSPPPQSL